jgi:hypothetical protein
MTLTIKIMQEKSPVWGSYDDTSGLASHMIVSGVRKVQFGRSPLTEDIKVQQHWVILDDEQIQIDGNVYVMNEAGKTISRFEGHTTYPPEELTPPKDAKETR